VAQDSPAPRGRGRQSRGEANDMSRPTNKARRHSLAWNSLPPPKQVVRVLLAHGIDVNARNEWGWTALHKVRHNKNCHGTHTACTY
jgi:ankyrin repeat protein